MSERINVLNKKCPKCDKIRFKNLPKNHYFSLQSIEFVEIANRFKPEIELKLNDLICGNCYKNGKRMKKPILAPDLQFPEVNND